MVEEAVVPPVLGGGGSASDEVVVVAPTVAAENAGEEEEVGYVLLEDCEVCVVLLPPTDDEGVGDVVSGATSDESSSSSPAPTKGATTSTSSPPSRGAAAVWVGVRLVREDDDDGGRNGDIDGSSPGECAEVDKGEEEARDDERKADGEGDGAYEDKSEGEGEEDGKPAAAESPLPVGGDDDNNDDDENSGASAEKEAVAEVGGRGGGSVAPHDRSPEDEDDRDDVCGRCDLLLRPLLPPSGCGGGGGAAQDTFAVDVAANAVGFDGTESDMKARRRRRQRWLSESDDRCCSPRCRRMRGGGGGGNSVNRSDAALLLGLALRCEGAGHVRIKSVRALLSLPAGEDGIKKATNEYSGSSRGIQRRVDDSNPRREEGEDADENDESGGGIGKGSPTRSNVGMDTSSTRCHITRKTVRVRASLVVTFSCAAYDAAAAAAECSSAVNANEAVKITAPSPPLRPLVRKRRRSSKFSGGGGGSRTSPSAATATATALPAEVQLLYSLIRSDWDRLDRRMGRLAAATATASASSDRRDSDIPSGGGIGGRRRAGETLFPPSLSLEQLYRRIRGARGHLSEDDDGMDVGAVGCGNGDGGAGRGLEGTSSTSPASGFRPLSDPSRLPRDLLTDRIAPYLRSKSLHSLRRTCRYLRLALRAAVPGLKLRLYRHQVASLEWMGRREARELTEDDLALRRSSPSAAGATAVTGNGDVDEEEDAVFGDPHRAATGGGTVLLAPRRGRRRRRRGGGSDATPPPTALRLDARTGSPLSVVDGGGARAASSAIPRLRRRVARGGLLCDDPGLGKTVTVMSLILRTFGQSTEEPPPPPSSLQSRCTRSKRHTDEDLFRAYWAECLEEEVGRRPALSSLLGRLRRSDRESGYFEHPVDPERDMCPDYFDVVDAPMSFRDVKEKVSAGIYEADLDAFRSDVELCFSNAMLYNPPDHFVHQAAKRMSQHFATLTNEFKAEHVRNATRAFSSHNANRDGSVAAMLAERARDDLLDSLCPSCSTLLVVPNTLLAHWEEQITMHIDFAYCTSKTPIVYRHSTKKSRSSSGRISLDNLEDLSSTHCPLIFIDESVGKSLPSPEILAKFHIVITTSQRLIMEYKRGSLEEEIEAAREGGTSAASSYRDAYLVDSEGNAPAASSLLKVHWLRLVVDEGHSMGRGGIGNSIQFASWIVAQRRWAMTGTPTQRTASSSGLRNVFGLMSFLKHDLLAGPAAAACGGGASWAQSVARGWNEGKLASFFRLRSLLSLLMVRHTKRNIEEIPPPVFVRTFVDLSPQEITTYNTLVSAVQSNIALTTMEGKTSGWQDSLLNPRQSRNANEALSNMRLVCCGISRMLPTVKREHWDETLDMLRTKHGCDRIKVTLCEHYLRRATTGELSSCMSCGVQVQTLFVVPCGDLVCTECIDNRTKACPVCDVEFDPDDFQLLQPGMTYTWVHNLEEEKQNRESKERLKRQLSMSRGLPGMNEAASEVVDDDEIDESAAVEHDPNEVLVMPQIRRRRAAHTCTYSRSFLDGKCETCSEEHFDCNFMNDKSQCSVCFKKAEDCPDHASKASYVIEKLLKLRATFSSNGGSSIASLAASRFAGEAVLPKLQQPLKVIIFSQYRSILNYFGDRIIRRFGGACVAEYWGVHRNQELIKFAKSSECFCMLLSQQGSHGLDLSFVTHIFFLDTIYDKSLESQVVARAYRMGATARVTVEELVAKHTVEESILKLSNNSDTDCDYHDEGDVDLGVQEESLASPLSSSSHRHEHVLSTHSAEEKQAKQAKLHFLLKNSSLVKSKKRKSHDRIAKLHGDHQRRVRIRIEM